MSVIVITGASRGLGRGLVDAFTAAGHDVHGCSRASGVDVTDARAVDDFAVRVGAPIDLWVNNAGVLAPLGPLGTLDPAEVEEHLRINVLGVVNGTQAFLRHRSPDGVLVNISSGAAVRPYPHWGAYCASKAAVDMLTEVAAAEGARAYAVAPGLIDTDMQAMLRASDIPDRQRYLDASYNSPAWVAGHLLEVAFGDRRPPVRWRVPDEGGVGQVPSSS
jgi:NAD(P)-dependent dehydrogenase (short-subunit alcohol dehydrogenase family)